MGKRGISVILLILASAIWPGRSNRIRLQAEPDTLKRTATEHPPSSLGAAAEIISLAFSGQEVQGIAVNPCDHSMVYALVYPGGLYRSVDFGYSWMLVNSLSSRFGYLKYAHDMIKIDARDPATIYWRANGTIYKSSDGGYHCRAVAQNGPFTIDPQVTSTIYWGDGNDLRRSTNGGDSWESVFQGPATIVKIAIDPFDSETIIIVCWWSNWGDPYCSTEGWYLRSSDGGISWSTILHRYRFWGWGCADFFNSNILFDPANPFVAYMVIDTTLNGSLDAGQSWATISGMPDSGGYGLALSPLQPDLILAGCFRGLYSSDKGLSWTLLGLESETISNIAVDFQGEKRIYVATFNGLYGIGPFLPLPQVKILSPGPGEEVFGLWPITAEIRSGTKLSRAEFYVDDKKIGEIQSSGQNNKGMETFNFIWDTRPYALGRHDVSVMAYDADGRMGKAELRTVSAVTVKNVILDLNVVKISERAWIIRKPCAKLEVEIENRGQVAMAKYTIWRQVGSGTSAVAKEFTDQDVQNGVYRWIEMLPDGNVFKYWVEANDARGTLIGESSTVQITR